MKAAPFSPALALPGSLELEAYHYGRAAAYHTASELVGRLVRQDWTPAGMVQAVPGVESVRTVATTLRAYENSADTEADATLQLRNAPDLTAAIPPVPPEIEDGGDPATELYWRRVEQSAVRRGDTDGAHTAHRRRWEILGIELQAMEAAAAERGTP